MTLRLIAALLLLSPTLCLAQGEVAADATTPEAEAAEPVVAEAAAEAAAEAPAEPAAAPEAPTPPPGYEQVSGAGSAQSPIEAPPLVIVSYVVIWLLTLLYLFYLWRRQAALKAEIDALQARLLELDGK
ncbi:MAG: CcmD family protein [Deltaproteobacteria bacterium]|nr:CcmD family protein [Deltaproteobacteria bacterium]